MVDAGGLDADHTLGDTGGYWGDFYATITIDQY